MYKKFIILAAASFLLFLNCSTDEPFKPVTENDQKGIIVFKVIWPSTKYAAKTADIEAVSSITAYVNSSSGSEITHADLIHEGSRGKAEISVEAGSNYKVIMVAFENSMIKYIGSDDDVDVVAGGTTTAEVAMVNAAPTLNSGESSGSNAYSFSWSSSPFATNYKFQQDDNDSFSSPSEFSGSILTKSFTNVAAGKYYHRVCSISKYGTTIWSETKTVEVGSNGTIIIDVPWPEDVTVNLSVKSPLATNYQYQYTFTSASGGFLTVTGEVFNSGTANASNVSLTLIARNNSGTYMDELTENIGTIAVGSSKGFNLTFSAEVFNEIDKPASTCDYTLTCSEGGPFTGSVAVQ